MVPSKLRSQAGLTLIELIIAMTVIAISVSGIVQIFAGIVRYSGDPMQRQQANAISEAYLEEIMLQQYLDPDLATVCPPNEGARDLYDNVCDYDGLNDNGARDQTGAVIPGLASYQVQVNVDQTTATLVGVSATLNNSNDVLRIDVTVTPPLGDSFVVSAYRTNS